MGKTETTRERAVTVYLPTKDMVKEWKTAAETRGIPLSRFVGEIVDEAIRKDLKGVTPREELERERDTAFAENKRLKERAEQSESLLKQAEVTVAEYRAKVSAASPSSYDEKTMGKLVSLLMECYSVGSPVISLDDIPDAIWVNPTNAKGVAEIRDCLNFLSSCGLIEEDMTGVRWKNGRNRINFAATGKDRGRKWTH